MCQFIQLFKQSDNNGDSNDDDVDDNDCDCDKVNTRV